MHEPKPQLQESFVERGEVTVMCRLVAGDPDSIRRGWAELEAAVGSLQRRRFYGVFDATTGEYRACVEVQEGDRADDLGLGLGSLPGGRYLRVRLHGEPPGVYDLIAPTFDRLVRRPDFDSGRPTIEFYRRRDEIDLLLPVA